MRTFSYRILYISRVGATGLNSFYENKPDFDWRNRLHRRTKHPLWVIALAGRRLSAHLFREVISHSLLKEGTP